MRDKSFSTLQTLIIVFTFAAHAESLQAQLPGLPPPPILPPPPLPENRPITFDELAPDTVVSRQYEDRGVIFEGSPRVVPAAPVASVTPPNVLESLYGGDIPNHPGPLRFRFTALVRKVSVRVGNRYSGGPEQHAILRVYDDRGNLIQRTSVFLGSGRKDVTQLLSIDAGSNRIRRADVWYAFETNLDGVPIDIETNGVETIDNLYFEGDAPPPPPPPSPPVVRILRPSPGQVFFGSNAIRLEGTITDADGLSRVSVRQEFLDTGEPALEWNMAWAGSAPDFTFPRFPDVTRVNLHPGRNRLTVTAVDSRGAEGSAQVTVSYGPPPIVTITSPADGATVGVGSIRVRGSIRKDLGTLRRTDVTVRVESEGVTVFGPRAVDSLSGSTPLYEFETRVELSGRYPRTNNRIIVTARDEGGAEGSAVAGVTLYLPDRVAHSGDLVVTQAIEGGWLVAGRRTAVRITPWVRDGRDHRGVRAELHGFRGGVELPESPLAPFSAPAIDLESGLTYDEVHGDASKTWDFLLPSSWTQEGTIELLGVIDPDNTLAECETCMDNNFREATVTFRLSGTLRVRPIRMTVRYADGVERTITEAQALQSMEAIRRVLPYGRLEILPPRVFRPGRLRDPARGLESILEDLYDRFTCFDSDDVWGWIEDTIVGCSWNTYTLGLLPAGPGGLLPGGLAYVPSPGGVAEATPWVAAHELSHAIGRKHAGNGHGESGGGGYDRRYPNPHGTVNGYGFDTTDWVAIRPRYDAPGDPPSFTRSSFRDCDPSVEACFTHDYMSYGNNPFWISAYTWNGIFNAGFTGSRGIGGGGGAGIPVTGRVVHIRGLILEDGTVETREWYTLEAPEGWVLEPGGGALTALVADAGGNTLAKRAIEPTPSVDGGARRFSFLLPLPEGAEAVELYLDGALVERREVSRPPTVTVTAPIAGTTVAAGETFTVAWEAADPDGDPLTYAVGYSPDAGESWTILATGLEVPFLEVDAAEIPGSDKAMVRVLATDGVVGSIAYSGKFAVGDKPPYVVILSPRDREELPAGPILVFEASAVDREDGGSVDTIRWSSDRDGELGKGFTLDVAGLSTGRHEIRAEAEDSRGNVGFDTAVIYVGTQVGEASFIRGDTNGDGTVNIADPVKLLDALFVSGSPLSCEDAADADDNGTLNITDAIYVLSHLFVGGPAPKPPYPEAGRDPTPDGLRCGD